MDSDASLKRYFEFLAAHHQVANGLVQCVVGVVEVLANLLHVVHLLWFL